MRAKDFAGAALFIALGACSDAAIAPDWSGPPGVTSSLLETPADTVWPLPILPDSIMPPCPLYPLDSVAPLQPPTPLHPCGPLPQPDLAWVDVGGSVVIPVLDNDRWYETLSSPPVDALLVSYSQPKKGRVSRLGDVLVYHSGGSRESDSFTYWVRYRGLPFRGPQSTTVDVIPRPLTWVPF